MFHSTFHSIPHSTFYILPYLSGINCKYNPGVVPSPFVVQLVPHSYSHHPNTYWCFYHSSPTCTHRHRNGGGGGGGQRAQRYNLSTDTRGGHTYTCCTDTRDRDQSEIKRSTCKIGDKGSRRLFTLLDQGQERFCSRTPPIPRPLRLGDQESRLFLRCDQPIKVQK